MRHVSPKNLLLSMTAPLLGVLSAMFVWLTAQVGEYAVLDDYRMVTAVKVMRPFVIEGHATTELNTGRVVPALLFDVVWSGVKSIDDLWYVRLLGFLVVGVTVVHVQSWIIRSVRLTSSFSRIAIGITSFLVMLLPCVAATTTWAQKSTQLLALPFAMSAGILAGSERAPKWRWPAVMLLILLSAFTYQHFTPIAVFPVLVSAATRSTAISLEYLRRIAGVIGCVLVSLVANLVFVRNVAPDVLERIEGRTLSNRLADFIDVLAKAVHLQVDKDPQLLALSLLLVVLLFTICVIARKSATLIAALVLVASVISAGVTIGGDGDSSYRMTFPTQIVFWLGVGCLAAFALAEEQAQLSRTLKVTILGLLVIVAAILSADGSNTLGKRISIANATDLANMKCQIQNLNGDDLPEVVIVKLSSPRVGAGQEVASEIGLLASNVEWTVRDQWNALVSESPNFQDLSEIRLVVIESGDVLPPAEQSPIVIDSSLSCRIYS